MNLVLVATILVAIFFDTVKSFRFSRSYKTNPKVQLKMNSVDSSSYPISLIVNVEIKKDRLEDFLKVIEEDAIGSRERENGGCLRFDVHRDKTDECKFVFYEVYKNDDAVIFHKNTPHFKLWTDFKASGGVVSQSVIKADAIFFG